MTEHAIILILSISRYAIIALLTIYSSLAHTYPPRVDQSGDAQFKPIEAVLLSSGTNLMNYYHHKSNPEILEIASYAEEFKAAEEANNIYKAISKWGAPSILLASDAIPDRLKSYMKYPKSEFKLANEVFKDVIASGHMSVITLPTQIISDPKYQLSEAYTFPDRWIRDWGPFKVENTLVTNKAHSRGDVANPLISNHLKLKLDYSDYAPVGGAFMKTASGICALSFTHDPSRRKILGKDVLLPSELTMQRAHFLKTALGCKKILKIEPLPLEPLGHLDLFVKFLSNNTVAVAKYTGDEIQVRSIRKVNSTECFPLKEKPCSQTWHNRFYTGSLDKIEAHNIEFNQFTKYLTSQYGNAKFNFDEQWQALGVDAPLNLKKFSDNLISQFKSEGFEVIEVLQPQPLMTITINQHKEMDGRIQIDNISSSLIYPTYLNSILVNGTAFIPSYNHWATKALNRNAVTKYEAAGYAVMPLPSDFLILEGGTIHCISKEIH